MPNTKAGIESWVAEKRDLSDGAFSGVNLREASLRKGQFAGSDFSRADLSCAYLKQADLKGCRFDGAIMYGTDLAHADLTDASLIGADLRDAQIEYAILTDCRGVFDAGTDDRGYRFIGVMQTDGTWMIKAGCRWYTSEEAIQHWNARGNNDALLRVNAILDSTNAQTKHRVTIATDAVMTALETSDDALRERVAAALRRVLSA